MAEIYQRCKENLSFFQKKSAKSENTENHDDSTSANASPMKNNFCQIDDEFSHLLINETENPVYYDNNYWSRVVSDFDFEII